MLRIRDSEMIKGATTEARRRARVGLGDVKNGRDGDMAQTPSVWDRHRVWPI